MKKLPTDPKMVAEIADLKDKLARSLADYANLEKRIESQKQLYAALASAAIINKFVEVLDDFHLAQAHLKDQGLQMALDKMTNLLKSEGLEEIPTDNLEFDPATMNCVEVAEGKQNVVVTTRKKGYSLNGQTLRPAQVVVGRERT